jgi:hypothetical protein
MEERSQLHIRRIREGLTQLAEIRKRGENAFSPDFKAWKQRVAQSIREVFGKDHDYTRRFARLGFWETRISLGQHRWSPQDQKKFEEDAVLAERLLSDVLEELDVAPRVRESGRQKASRTSVTPIIINVKNVLSQTVDIAMSQLLSSLDDLPLSGGERAQAEKLARELADEARGKQRWPVIAKTLEMLKGLGKSIYERVAIPLILEMLKKQAGL